MAAEHSAPINGKVVEILGHYEPTASDKKFVFEKEKIAAYLKNGAQPSNTVAKLLNKNGFDLPVHIRPEQKPRKVAEAKPEAPKAETASAEEVAGEESAPVEVAEPTEEAAPAAETVDESVVEEATPVVEEAPVEVAPAESEPAAEVPAADEPTDQDTPAA